MQCTELVRENTDALIPKSGEVWDLLGAQLIQHRRSTAVLPNRTFCDGGNDIEMIHDICSVQSSGY